MGIFHMIGDSLLYVVALPLFAFQSFEMLQALVDISNDIAEYGSIFKV